MNANGRDAAFGPTQNKQKKRKKRVKKQQGYHRSLKSGITDGNTI